MLTKRWGAEERVDGVSSEKRDDSSDTGTVSHEDGHIWFYKDITQDSVHELASNLHKAAVDRRTVALQLGIVEPPPIHLHIHSYGGSVFSGFAGADAVMRSVVPVHTHVEGGTASAATLISVVGSHRTIGSNSFVLIHQLSSAFWGKFEEFKDEMKNNELLMSRIRGLYAQWTKMTKKQIDDVLKHDLWFDADKALKAGLVDEVL